jgi:PAS domain S-box-containing protein
MHPVRRKPFANSLKWPTVMGTAAVGVYCVLMLILPHDERSGAVASDLLSPFFSLFSALALWIGARRSMEQGLPGARAWLLLAIARALTVVGDVTWAVIELGMHGSPYPSVADLFYLSFYPLFAVGLLFMPTLARPRSERARWSLELGITALSGWLVIWTFLLAPLLAYEAGSGMAFYLSLGYGLGDLVLFAALVVLIFQPATEQPRLPLWLLAAGIAVMLVTDFLFMKETMQQTYITGGLLDVGWAAGSVLMGLAGLAQAQQAGRVPKGKSRVSVPAVLQRSGPFGISWMNLLPYLAALWAFSLLLWAHDRLSADSYMVLVLGVGAVIVLVLARQVLALRENSELVARMQREVDERQQIESELAEERNLLRTVIDNLPDSIYVKDLDGRFQLGNQAVIRLLGCDSEDAVRGKTDVDFYPTDLANRYRADERALLDGTATRIDQEEPVLDIGTGQPKWHLTTKVPLRDVQGRLTGLVGIGRDITRRKSIEEAERRQRALAEALRDSAAALTSSLTQEVVMERMLGHVGRVVAHDSANVMLIDGDVARVVACHGYDERGLTESVLALRFPIEQVPHLLHIAQTGEPAVIADTRTDSEWVDTPATAWVRSYTAAPISLRGHVIGFLNLDSGQPAFFTRDDAERLCAFADQAAIALENARLFAEVQRELGERGQVELALQIERASLAERVEERTAELSSAAVRLQAANRELAQAARLKDEFLASMSHELRTPLNAVLIHAQTLGEGIYGDLNEKQLRSICAIEEGGNRLLVLINNILDLSRIGAGKLELLMDTVAVDSLCQNCLRAIRDETRQKEITVVLNVDPQVETIHGDERRLRQVLGNLLSNAVKFTPAKGSLGLDVTGDLAQHQAHFTVWDTGIGISEENIGRLFQQFVQLDGSLARRYEGTGLGLALVSRLTELHGGCVTVTSAPGKGSRFTVSLPWGEDAHEAK